MKKTASLLCCALLVAVIAGGCTSVQTAEKFRTMTIGEGRKQAVSHINVSIDGWYLLNLFPLFTGSAAGNGRCAVFQDNVTVETAVSVAAKEARGNGGNTLVDLVSSTSSLNLLLIGYRQVQVSVSTIQ